MRCLDCNSDNPEGTKFCGNCGAPLCNICPSCGCSNPVQFKFCGNCGVPLTSPQAPDELSRIQKYIPSYLAEKIRQSRGHIEGERKDVTVVFSDISGFTSMSEKHDPEEVSVIATTCHTMLGRLVYKYEGVVDKIVGDGLMAIFGVPTHEDDPERAVLAAMEMQEEMQDLSEKLKKSMDVSLGLSIGINTGVVVIGDVGTNLRLDYTVIGDVVNTASRLQEEARPGEILVTGNTYTRSSHFFDFQSLEPVYIRGKSEPVDVHKVIQRKERPLQTRGIEGLRAPLIGRDKEFALCRQAVDHLTAGKGGTLIITGEAGLGKSRLAEELKKYVSFQNITWLEGKCVSYANSINYWVFMDALKNYFGIISRDTATEIEVEVRKKGGEQKARITGQNGEIKSPYDSESLVSTIVSLLSSEIRAEQISDDLAESERKLRIFTAIRDVLIAESRSKPLILMLEDLHWADEISMELILFLMKRLSQYKITFVWIYRPVAEDSDNYYSIQKLEDARPAKPESFYAKIALNPLSSGDSNVLLESLLSVESLPSEMKELILDKASGNPLYLEEVIRSIIDDGAIEQQNGEWMAVKDVEDIAVSSTVQGVIMARLDRLDEESKHVLQCASVIGLSFEYDLLSYLVTGRMSSTAGQAYDEDRSFHSGSNPLNNILETTDVLTEVGEPRSEEWLQGQDLDIHLKKLEEMGFIAHEGSNEKIFRFRHVLIQDVTYSNILRRTCKKLHEMVGHYIEELHPNHLDEFYEILAYHYTNSNDIEAALSYLIKAGNKNKKSPAGSAQSALRYFREALTKLDNSSLTEDECILYKQEIYNGQGDAYTDLGKYDMALASFEEVLSLTEQTEDDLTKAEAMRKIAMNKDQTGDWEAALEVYEKSLAIVQNLGELTQMGLVYNNIGYGYFERGDLDEAMKYFQKVLEIGKRSGDSRLIGDVINNLGMIASLRGGFDEAIKYYEDCVSKFQESDDWHGLAQAYQNLGIAYFRKGMLAEADDYYKRSLEISEKRGIYRLITYTSLNRAEMYLAWPDLSEAKSFCDRAFEILSFLDDKWARAEGYKYYGVIYKCQQDYLSAKEAFLTSLKVSKECDHLPNMAEVHCEIGAMSREEGMLDEALEHFGKSREIFGILKIAEEVQRLDEYIAEINSQ